MCNREPGRSARQIATGIFLTDHIDVERPLSDFAELKASSGECRFNAPVSVDYPDLRLCLRLRARAFGVCAGQFIG